MVKNPPAKQETQVQSLDQENALEKEIPVFLPGESHGKRSLAGSSLWFHKESDMTERLNNNSNHTHLSYKNVTTLFCHIG